jgi:DNA repair exonuclease SbcCD nuclease subunit
MPQFSFLHAADLHLDSPMRGLDPEAPVEQIRRATRDALINMVDFAIKRQVAFVLLAGDLYDGNWKDWRTGQFLVQQLGRLLREGIEVVAISGNHDAAKVLSLRVSVPGLMGTDKPTTRLLKRAPVAVHGQGFEVAATTVNLALDYPNPVDGLFNIGLLHTACGSSAHANYAPCGIEDLVRKGYDYWALGHVHARAELLRDPWIVFPGNLQGRHINEEGPRGATLVTVSDGRVSSVDAHALDVLRWRRVTVDVTGAATLDDILARARLLLDIAALDAEERLLVVRVIFSGDCMAHAELAHSPTGTLQQLRAAAAEIADISRLWIESVVIDTRPAIDLAALRAQPGPVGALIGALDRAPEIDPGLKTFVEDQLRRANGVLPPDHPAMQIAAGHIPGSLVQRARAMVLAELARR